MLGLPDTPRRRRAALTPMIDVVFLLLVFFMLAARFGLPQALPLTLASRVQGAEWNGPPRLVEIGPEGLWVNGVAHRDLLAALAPLITDRDDLIVLRAREQTSTQRLLNVMQELRDAGHMRLVVVE